MKTLTDFYEEKKKQALPNLIYSFSKPRYREPLNAKEQETLTNCIKQIYNPRIKKLKEPDYFLEEWMEPQIQART